MPHAQFFAACFRDGWSLQGGLLGLGVQTPMTTLPLRTAAMLFVFSICYQAQVATDIKDHTADPHAIRPVASAASPGPTRTKLQPEDRAAAGPSLFSIPHAELIKIIDAPCDSGSPDIINIRPQCDMSVEGGGSQYSFRTHGYSFSNVADVRLVNGVFVTGSKFTLTLIVDLGNIDLGTVTPEADGIRKLAEFKPGETVSFVRRQAALIDKTLIDGKFTFGTSARVHEGDVYGLRSTAYRVDGIDTDDKRVDVIVAFKVVRVDLAGDVTLVSKEMRRTKSAILDLTK